MASPPEGCTVSVSLLSYSSSGTIAQLTFSDAPSPSRSAAAVTPSGSELPLSGAASSAGAPRPEIASIRNSVQASMRFIVVTSLKRTAPWTRRDVAEFPL